MHVQSLEMIQCFSDLSFSFRSNSRQPDIPWHEQRQCSASFFLPLAVCEIYIKIAVVIIIIFESRKLLRKTTYKKGSTAYMMGCQEKQRCIGSVHRSYNRLLLSLMQRKGQQQQQNIHKSKEKTIHMNHVCEVFSA